MDPSSYAFQAARQSYGAPYQFPTPNSNGFGAVGVKLEPGPSSLPQIPGPGAMDAHIAAADHETLMRVQNAAYIQVWNRAQSVQASLDMQSNLLMHYNTILQGRGHGAPSTAHGFNAMMPGVGNPYGAASHSVQMAAGTAPAGWPFPVHDLPPPLSPDDYPDAKWWSKSSWKEETNAKTNKGQSKTDTDSRRSVGGNKKLAFLTDENGNYIGKTLLDQMGKTYFELLNDLQSGLGPRMPHSYSVAGESFKNHMRYGLAIRPHYMAFRLCDNLWKLDQYCIIKWSEWARNNLAEEVKEEKRKRREVIEVSDGEDDRIPLKKIKREPAATASKSTAPSKPSTPQKAPVPEPKTDENVDPNPKATPTTSNPKPRQKAPTKSQPTIPPIDASIIVPLKPPANPPANPGPSEAKPPAKGTSKKAPAPKAAKPSKAEIAAAKNAKPTQAKTSKNLYLIDYIAKHGSVTVGAFEEVWDKLEIGVKLEYERKSTSSQEEAKAKAQEKRAATRAAKAASKMSKDKAKVTKKKVVPAATEPIPEEPAHEEGEEEEGGEEEEEEEEEADGDE